MLTAKPKVLGYWSLSAESRALVAAEGTPTRLFLFSTVGQFGNGTRFSQQGSFRFPSRPSALLQTMGITVGPNPDMWTVMRWVYPRYLHHSAYIALPRQLSYPTLIPSILTTSNPCPMISAPPNATLTSSPTSQNPEVCVAKTWP